jgi:protein disulfide-isomerase A1
MKFLAIALLFAAAVFAQESDVVVLHNDNFHSFIKANPFTFVEFYAPWCGHCKKLTPDWEKAATALKGEVPVAKVDATVEEAVAQEFGVRGYPTIKFFSNGVAKDYQGARSAEALVSFARKQVRPALVFPESVDAAKEFAAREKVVVFGFFESKDSAEFAVYESLVNELRDSYSFAAVVGQSFGAAELGAAAGSSFVLFKQFDEGQAAFSGEVSAASLKSWINTESVPLLDEIGPENFQRYMDSGIPLLYLFLDPTADNAQLRSEVAAVAKDARGKVNFVWIDNAKYGSQASRLALSGKVIPAVAIDHAGVHFVFDESKPVEAAALAQWVNDFIADKVEATVKSEPIPETNDEPVKVVVAKSFSSIVLDSTKDVFVEFYAPWCGHCKKLAPIYDQLATKFASNPNVVIAKIDASANDVDPSYGVRGFPTLKFFPANNKKSPIGYEGDRSLEDMERFVTEKLTVAVAGGLREEL